MARWRCPGIRPRLPRRYGLRSATCAPRPLRAQPAPPTRFARAPRPVRPSRALREPNAASKCVATPAAVPSSRATGSCLTAAHGRASSRLSLAPRWVARMLDNALINLLAIAAPLLVGGFLAGLFTYYFERRRTRLEHAERRAVLLESLRRELAFVPEQLPAYRAGAVHFLPPIRTVVGGQLLDGQALDWRTDAQLIQPLLEFLGVSAIYNDLVAAVNAGQAGHAWPEDVQRHWHGQLLGAHASLLDTRRMLLARLVDQPGPLLARPPDEEALGPVTGAEDGWRVDQGHSRVGFSAKHMGIIAVHGQFRRADLQLELDDEDLTRSSVEARIDADSVSTGDDRRDA